MSKYFGKLAKDKVTGFTGIVTAKCKYMYGCTQFALSPYIDKDGKRIEGEWFDKGRIEILGPGVNPEDVQAKKGGCETREHPKC